MSDGRELGELVVAELPAGGAGVGAHLLGLRRAGDDRRDPRRRGERGHRQLEQRAAALRGEPAERFCSSDALVREHIDLSDLDGVAGFPLLEAREVDENYRYTGTTYALARGDGRLTVRNPHLGKTLILDSSNPNEPRRSGELDTGRRPPD